MPASPQQSLAPQGDDDSRLAVAKRRRRAQALPPDAEQPQDDDAAAEAEIIVGPDVGPKLTPSQRAELTRLIAIFEHVPTIREALYEEHPDFPQISDEAIRYHRRQLRKRQRGSVEALESQALTTGIARQATRLAHMNRRHQKLTRTLTSYRPVVDPQTGQQLADPQTGAPLWREEIDLLIARELREIETAAARETGALLTSRPAAGAASKAPAAQEQGKASAGQRREEEGADVREILEQVVEARVAAAVAMAGAQRPETVPLPADLQQQVT